MSDHVPLISVRLGEAEVGLVSEVIQSGQLAQGPMVKKLEELFATVAGTSQAIAVSSGTAALMACLRVLGLESGDEVITSPLTFGATLNAIIASGARARFADIGPDYTLDPQAVGELLSDRTRVLMPVHLYGLPADMPRLLEMVGEPVAIVEDAAQAVGASVDGRPVGSFGLGCFSLYATKNVTTGEGGVITCDDDRLADELRMLRNQGMQGRYEYARIGENLRLTDLQAALGIPQMERLSEINGRRRENAARLLDGLHGVDALQLPVIPRGREHVFHQFTVRVTPNAPLSRDQLIKGLTERGVESGVYYPRLVFDHGPYEGHPQVAPDKVPRAREAVDQVLSLPVHQHLSLQNLDTVIEAIRHLLGA